MSVQTLRNAWKTVHAKFVKPLDTALDSFAMLLLQWILGVYSIWDVLHICSGVCVSAFVYLANAVRHPSALWSEEEPQPQPPPQSEEAEAEEVVSEPVGQGDVADDDGAAAETPEGDDCGGSECHQEDLEGLEVVEEPDDEVIEMRLTQATPSGDGNPLRQRVVVAASLTEAGADKQ